MATVNAKKRKAVAAPQNLGEAAQFVRLIGEVERSLARLDLEMNEQIELVKSSFEGRVKSEALQMDTLVAGLYAYAEGNRLELTNDGKTKTVSLPTGTFGWRMTPKSVEVTGKAKDVLEALERLKLEQFIRRKPEINKEAMLADEELAGTVNGITIGQHELFSVKPSVTNAEVTAKKGQRKLKAEVVADSGQPKKKRRKKKSGAPEDMVNTDLTRQKPK